MHFSSVREDFFKAQAQNHYEKIRCDLYLKEVTKRHVHSLTNINKSIEEARDTLRDIRASSGYCRPRAATTAKSNAWKEREWSAGTSRPNGGKPCRREMQATWKASPFKSKDSDSGQEPPASKTGVSRSSVLYEKTERNVVDGSEYSMHGKNGAGRGDTGSEVNGDRDDIVSAGRLLRDEILKLPDGRNASSGGTRGTSRQRMDSNIKEPQGKHQDKSKSSANGGNSQNAADSSSGQNVGSLTSPESALGTCKFGISRPNTVNGGYRRQTAPEKASQVKSAAELKNSRSRYSAASEVKNVKIHVSLSRSERKKILQDLISTCTVPCDRSALERERQRLLQEKIHRFFELLFAQDDKGDRDDEGDIFDDN